MELSRGWWRIQNHQRIQRGAGEPLWQVGQRGRFRHQVADADLRRRTRDVRGIQPQQVRSYGRDSVDAEQCLAFDDLAFVRLLFASGRWILRREAGDGRPASDLWI